MTAKFTNLSSKLTAKLLPIANKLLDKADKFIDKLGNLSDEEQNNVIKIGLIVASIGPLIKIVGTAGTVIGTTTKAIGKISEAIGKMKNNATSATTAITATTATITALATVMAVINQQVKDETEETRNFISELDNSVNSRKQTMDAIKEQQNANLSEIANVQKLSKELKILTDENGKVKDGYENRAQFILNQLNNALGTEYSMTGNVIDKYQDLIGTLDDVILKKKASLILESQEAQYSEAINNKTKAYEDYLATQKELENVEKQLIEAEGNLAKNLTQGSIDAYKQQQTIKTLKEQHESLTNSLGTQENQLQKYQNAIDLYEKNNERYLEGSAESLKAIEESIVTTQSKVTDDINAELNERIKNQINNLNEAKKIYDLEAKYNKDAKDSIYATNVENEQKNLEQLASELASKTSTIEDLGQEEIKAWKTLSEQSYDVYQKSLGKMDPTMRQKIADVTGVVYRETPMVSEAMESMSNEILSRLDNDENFKNKALSSMYSYLNGLNDDELRVLLNQAGIEDANKVMQGIRDGNLAEEQGVNILKSLTNGLNNSSFTKGLFATAKSITSRLSDLLTVKAKVSTDTNKGIFSLIPGHKLGLDYVPKDNYIARLHKGERVLTAEENKDYTKILNSLKIPNYSKLQSKLASRMMSTNNTRNINNAIDIKIYPKSLNDSEINSLFDKINKKLGKLS